ncbi:hypothetical protein [uncultured Jannaschia sp.]|uniref:PIN domain-containing protein n=1 Tax=uncultured Jannaschia sp. TaxID=293347 RepID=UPI003422F439
MLTAGATTRPLVLDSYTALLLEDLGLLEVVASAFQCVLLPSSLMNELSAHAETFVGAGDEPTFSLSFEDGRIVKTEQRPEDNAVTHQHMTGLIAQLRDTVEVVGTEMPERLTRSRRASCPGRAHRERADGAGRGRGDPRRCAEAA